MRILVFSSYWPRPNQVHPATFEVHQVAALAEAGHDVEVIVQTVPWRWRSKFVGAADLDLPASRVRVRQIIVPRFPEVLARSPLGIRLSIWMTGLRVKAWIEGFTNRNRTPDLVIVHGERNIGLSASIWNRGLKYPTGMIIHGADPVLEATNVALLQDRVGGIASCGVSRIILVGNRLRPYAQRLGYDSNRIAVIPNGFHHPRPAIRSPGRNGGPVRLVSVARLVAVKGIDDTLCALASLLKRNPQLEWSYDVLGDGPERSRLLALAKRLGLEMRVRFSGSVANREVLKVLENSDVFVLPSWNEAFGIAYLEAMAMGTTVVGCLENGAADIISDGIDGCLVPPRNYHALSKVLEELIVDPDRRELLARAAMERVRRFSWSDNARAVIEAVLRD